MAQTKKGIGDRVKKHKTLYILLAAFALLMILYFVMVQVNKKKAEEEAAKDAEVTFVTDISDVTFMEYTDGETVMSFVKEDDTWYVKDNKELALDSTTVDAVMNAVCQVEAVRVLEDADAPEAYGLEEAAYTITLKNDAGDEVVLYIGDLTGDDYYATVDDKEIIYTIDYTAVSALDFDISTFEAIEEEDTESTDEGAESTDDAETTE